MEQFTMVLREADGRWAKVTYDDLEARISAHCVKAGTNPRHCQECARYVAMQEALEESKLEQQP